MSQRQISGNEMRGSLADRMVEERERAARMARDLGEEARDQWQRAIGGMLAFPAAVALGMAASVMYMAAFVERGFEIFQRTADEARMGYERQRRDMNTNGERELLQRDQNRNPSEMRT